jgi:hypothetical protein
MLAMLAIRKMKAKQCVDNDDGEGSWSDGIPEHVYDPDNAKELLYQVILTALDDYRKQIERAQCFTKSVYPFCYMQDRLKLDGIDRTTVIRRDLDCFFDSHWANRILQFLDSDLNARELRQNMERDAELRKRIRLTRLYSGGRKQQNGKRIQRRQPARRSGIGVGA